MKFNLFFGKMNKTYFQIVLYLCKRHFDLTFYGSERFVLFILFRIDSKIKIKVIRCEILPRDMIFRDIIHIRAKICRDMIKNPLGLKYLLVIE